MRELLLVLDVKLQSNLKGAVDFRWRSILKNFSTIIIFGGFAVGTFYLARACTSYLMLQAHIGPFLFHRFLSMLLYVFFLTVNLGNMIVCYATLYKSTEVDFLMGLPVSHENIFLIKFIDNFFYSSSTLTLLGLAFLLGYGSFFNFPWYANFLIMFAVLLPFMLIAGLVAVLTLMAFIKVASRIGLRWLLALVIVMYFLAIYLYFRFTNPVQLVNEVMKYYPNVNSYFGFLDPPFVRYLPNHWVAEFLYWVTRGDQARALPYLLYLGVTLVALIVIAGKVAKRYYYESWVAVSDAKTSNRSRAVKPRFRLLEFGKERFFRPQTNAFVRRDIGLFFREPSQWLHLLLMVMLLMIFLVSISSVQLKLTQPFLRVVSFLAVFLFDGFMIASVTLRFVFPAISLESDTFWIVRSAPVSLPRLYWLKFGFLFVLVLGVAEVLSVLSSTMLHDNILLTKLSAVGAAFLALSLTGLNLGAGAYFAIFKEKNPIRIASSQGASLTFLISMIYLALVAVIMIIPLNTYFERLIIHGVATTEWIYVPLAVIGVLSVVVFSASTAVGLKSISRDY